MSELEAAVRRRAAQRCEYCLLPQGAFQRFFQIEHIIARQHGGESTFENLALSCRLCNLKKGPNLAGIDPTTKRLTPLYHPRIEPWARHFAVLIQPAPVYSLEIQGITPIGRTTAYVLGFNDELRSTLRYLLNLDSQYPWRR